MSTYIWLSNILGVEWILAYCTKICKRTCSSFNICPLFRKLNTKATGPYLLGGTYNREEGSVTLPWWFFMLPPGTFVVKNVGCHLSTPTLLMAGLHRLGEAKTALQPFCRLSVFPGTISILPGFSCLTSLANEKLLSAHIRLKAVKLRSK